MNRKPIQECVARVLFLLLIGALTACAAAEVPEASKQRSRAVINAGEIVPADEIRVAEYLQYYEQYFPEPAQDAIGLDLRLGNSQIPAEGALIWLQIGLQTQSEEQEMVAPLNLALVIDRSGSMSDADKMPYLKESLKLFLHSLNPDDIVSIVTYSDKAELLHPAQSVRDGGWIERAVDGILPTGSTNLHAGLMLGFQQVEKSFDLRRNNRVILLTDGIANRGVTDPQSIAADALEYNQKGIYLATIGLGLEFNDPLLSTLADQGQAGYTFVDSAREMERVFHQQASGLKQRVASDVVVTVVPEPGVRLIGLTGLEGAPPPDGASVPLWPMGTGNSAVIMAQIQVGPARSAGLRSLAKVTLVYRDLFAQRMVTVDRAISAEVVSGMTGYDPTWDLEIYRNVTIQRTAEGMREISTLFDSGEYEAAWRIAVRLEQQLNELSRLIDDPQIKEDSSLLQRYQQTLADAVWDTQSRAPALETQVNENDSERPYRVLTPTAAFPKVEVR